MNAIQTSDLRGLLGLLDQLSVCLEGTDENEIIRTDIQTVAGHIREKNKQQLWKETENMSITVGEFLCFELDLDIRDCRPALSGRRRYRLRAFRAVKAVLEKYSQDRPLTDAEKGDLGCELSLLFLPLQKEAESLRRRTLDYWRMDPNDRSELKDLRSRSEAFFLCAGKLRLWGLL